MSLIRSLCVSQILCFLSSFVYVSEGKDDDNLSVASVDDDYLYFDTDDKESDLNKKKKNKYLQGKRKRSPEPKNLSNGNSKNNTKKYKILNKQKKQQISKKNKNIAKSEKVGLQASKLFYRINNNFLESNEFKEKCKETRYLNVFAFNVGQANCIVLRCGDEVVIVDAGTPSRSKALGKDRNSIPSELEINILPQIDKVLENTKIKAVFITHPHTDHYNLIECLFQTYWPNQKESCRLFLGGTKQDWETIFSFGEKPTSKKQEKKQSTGKEKTCIEGILKGVTFKDVTYVTSAKDRQQRDIHDIFSNHDIVFSFILPEKFVEKGSGEENGLSFLMKVTHTKTHTNNNCSFLFTGDAEGDNLQGAIGSANRKEILEALINELPKDKIKIAPNYDKLLQSSNSKSDIIANRTLFNNIGCVFVPHHGSRTEDSGRFISYLEDQPIPPATFIICSEVSSSWNKLPQRGAWESVSRQIKHPAHFVTYHNGKNKKIKLTKKRVYITEAAPGGVYWLVSDGETIWMYNAYREDPDVANSDLGFFPITTVSNKIKEDWGKINPNYNKCISNTNPLDNPNGKTLRPVCKGSDRLENAYKELRK